MATPKKRIKKRKVSAGPGERAATKRFMDSATGKNHDPGADSRWETLEELCQQLADAQQAGSWKGGGDPDAIPIIEAELELAKMKLCVHIDGMRRYYEGTQ